VAQLEKAKETFRKCGPESVGSSWYRQEGAGRHEVLECLLGAQDRILQLHAQADLRKYVQREMIERLMQHLHLANSLLTETARVQMHYYALSFGFDRVEDVRGVREEEGSARSVRSRTPNPSLEEGGRTRERLVPFQETGQSAIETTAMSLYNTDSRNYKKSVEARRERAAAAAAESDDEKKKESEREMEEWRAERERELQKEIQMRTLQWEEIKRLGVGGSRTLTEVGASRREEVGGSRTLTEVVDGPTARTVAQMRTKESTKVNSTKEITDAEQNRNREIRAIKQELAGLEEGNYNKAAVSTEACVPSPPNSFQERLLRDIHERELDALTELHLLDVMTPNTSSKSAGLRALTPKPQDLHATAGSGRDRVLSEKADASLLELFR